MEIKQGKSVLLYWFLQVAILEYLEETRPSPALLPNDPVKRAQVRNANQAKRGLWAESVWEIKYTFIESILWFVWKYFIHESICHLFSSLMVSGRYLQCVISFSWRLYLRWSWGLTLSSVFHQVRLSLPRLDYLLLCVGFAHVILPVPLKAAFWQNRPREAWLRTLTLEPWVTSILYSFGSLVGQKPQNCAVYGIVVSCWGILEDKGSRSAIFDLPGEELWRYFDLMIIVSGANADWNHCIRNSAHSEPLCPTTPLHWQWEKAGVGQVLDRERI